MLIGNVLNNFNFFVLLRTKNARTFMHLMLLGNNKFPNFMLLVLSLTFYSKNVVNLMKTIVISTGVLHQRD